MFRVDQQAGIHELVGKQRGVLVVEQGAEFQSAGRGIDLVIGRSQFSRGDLVCLSGPSIDRERLPCAADRAVGRHNLLEW